MSFPQISEGPHTAITSSDKEYDQPTASGGLSTMLNEYSYDPLHFRKVAESKRNVGTTRIEMESTSREKDAFPVTNGRRYNMTREDTYMWLRYSQLKDAAFYAPCIAFTKQN